MEKLKQILLTERDLELFRFVNSFGYVRAAHVFKKLGVTQTFYRRLQQLTGAGFLMHEKIFQGLPGHYLCSKKAVEIAEDDLPPPRTVSLATYFHDMLVINLALEMEARTGGIWVPERRLRSKRKDKGLRLFSKHFPDGLMLIKNKTGKNLKIAVELEHLNRKSKKRLESIITNYLTGFNEVGHVDQVAYFCCSEAIKRKVTAVARETGAVDMVDVRLLSEILPETVEAGVKKNR